LSFFQGNLTREQATDLTKLVSQTLSLPVVSRENIIQNDHTAVPRGLTTIDLPRFGEDKNNVVTVVIKTAIHSGVYDENCIYVTLLKHFIKPLFYDDLRTKQQLGYVVFTMSDFSLYVDSFSFLVQSDNYDPEYITERIDTFRATIPTLVEGITEEQFQNLVKSFITNTLIKDKSVAENADRYWSSIITGDLNFNDKELLVALAKKCTREGLIAFTKKYFTPGDPEKREFLLRIWGKVQNQAEMDELGKKVVLSDIKDTLRQTKFPILCHARHKVFEPEQ